MAMTRRKFTLMAGASLMAGVCLPAKAQGSSAPKQNRQISLVLAPSNLGLRPVGRNQPGTWRAPQTLLDAGLADALGATEVVRLERPDYAFGAQPSTRIRNGLSIRTFSLHLATRVRAILQQGGFPVVIGGDCSILLGGLYGSRLAGGRGLVHVDGHSDFNHSANDHNSTRLGTAAGMDLALASGRGEALLTSWPEIGSPLASDADIVQLGERESTDPDQDHLPDTAIMQLTAQSMLTIGVQEAARRTIEKLQARGLDKVWLHVDLDVLDQTVMPAVDSPGSPGLNYAQLAELVGELCASGCIAGVNFAIYDPDRDPTARYAHPLVHCIADGIRGLTSA